MDDEPIYLQRVHRGSVDCEKNKKNIELVNCTLLSTDFVFLSIEIQRSTPVQRVA